MTTRCTLTPDWQGDTVAVLASGPSMNADVAQALRQYRCIVVNRTIRLAPWADMAVALDVDQHHAPEYQAFEGMRVCGFEDPDINALYLGVFEERVTIGPGHEISFRNSGLAAIRIARAMGAVRILIAGFDPETRAHWHDDEVAAPGPFLGVAEGLAAIAAELGNCGVAVERFTLPAPPVQTSAPLPWEPDAHV